MKLFWEWMNYGLAPVVIAALFVLLFITLLGIR
jgi:hypothetical protein